VRDLVYLLPHFVILQFFLYRNGYQWTGKGRWVSMTLRKPKKLKNKGPKWERQTAKAGPGALRPLPQIKDIQSDDDQEYVDNTEADDNEATYDSDREDAEGDDEDNDEVHLHSLLAFLLF